MRHGAHLLLEQTLVGTSLSCQVLIKLTLEAFETVHQCSTQAWGRPPPCLWIKLRLSSTRNSRLLLCSTGYQRVHQSCGLKAARVIMLAMTSSLSSWVIRRTAVHQQTHLLGQFLDAGAAFGQLQNIQWDLTSCRRQMLLTLLGSSALIALPAVAEPKFEQMEALKGKDYGKVRTK